MISPFACQRTAAVSGQPVRGSMRPFCDRPVICPRSFIQLASLLLPPGSVPRSVFMPRSHLNPCETRQFAPRQFGAKGSGVDVSASPTTVPRLLRIFAKKPTPLAGPPRVPRSLRMYLLGALFSLRASVESPLELASCAVTLDGGPGQSRASAETIINRKLNTANLLRVCFFM